LSSKGEPLNGGNENVSGKETNKKTKRKGCPRPNWNGRAINGLKGEQKKEWAQFRNSPVIRSVQIGRHRKRFLVVEGGRLEARGEPSQGRTEKKKKFPPKRIVVVPVADLGGRENEALQKGGMPTQRACNIHGRGNNRGGKHFFRGDKGGSL